MHKFHDVAIFQTHQHPMRLLIKIFSLLIIRNIPIILIVGVFIKQILLTIISTCVITLFIITYQSFFRKKSYFLISNYKISIKVRNGFFSKYHMSIFYENIKDIAYSKNHIFHFIFGYGTLFVRASAGSEGDFIASNLPNIEKIYKYVSFIYSLPVDERRTLEFLDDDALNQKFLDKTKSKNQIIEIERKKLLGLKGVKEVIILDDKDKEFIFKHEEDRNHGVYETINRDIVFCFTHDNKRRDADSPIAMKRGNKIIFPAVSFHEVNQKNTVSSSPSTQVHNYLKSKFSNLDEDDASVLVGFDF